MKKLLIISALFIVCGSCKKTVVDPVVSCEKAAEAYGTATTEYIGDINNVKKCQAFINAANALINDCPTISAADKKAAQASIAAVKCN